MDINVKDYLSHHPVEHFDGEQARGHKHIVIIPDKLSTFYIILQIIPMSTTYNITKKQH